MTPRPSASLVVVNERNEILLVHRNPRASSFGGMHVRPFSMSLEQTFPKLTEASLFSNGQVFPGGNLDNKQDQSLAVTAIRETFEEAGLLLASGSQPPDTLLDEARHEIHQQKLSFHTFLQSNNLQADVASLLPFTQWITPVGPPRCVFLFLLRTCAQTSA
jgi:8-oxo-dGTP pyrophosphatase MutT (NUDIX family)